MSVVDHVNLDRFMEGVVEGANMPTTLEGVHVFQDAKILYGPGKAANAGGVVVSGLEMSQNSERISWDSEKLERLLEDIMGDIHERCVTSEIRLTAMLITSKGQMSQVLKKLLMRC